MTNEKLDDKVKVQKFNENFSTLKNNAESFIKKSYEQLAGIEHLEIEKNENPFFLNFKYYGLNLYLKAKLNKNELKKDDVENEAVIFEMGFYGKKLKELINFNLKGIKLESNEKIKEILTNKLNELIKIIIDDSENIFIDLSKLGY